MASARFLDTNFEIGCSEEILSRILQLKFYGSSSTTIIHANLNTLFTCAKVPALKAALQRPDTLVLFEGIALQFARFMSGRIWWPDINGTDLVPQYLGMFRNEPLRVALVGGRAGIAEAAARTITAQHPNIIIVKTLNGFSDLSDTQVALSSIVASSPDILLLGLGTPLQEITSACWATSALIPVIWNVGGLFDLWAGARQRAPVWALSCRLEWLWRLVTEPSSYWPRVFIQGPWLFYKLLAAWPSKPSLRRVSQTRSIAREMEIADE